MVIDRSSFQGPEEQSSEPGVDQKQQHRHLRDALLRPAPVMRVGVPVMLLRDDNCNTDINGHDNAPGGVH